MSEPRRWWVYQNEEYGSTHVCDFNQRGFVPNSFSIEVIEAEPVLARIKQLETQLKEANEVAEFYASGKHFEWLGKDDFAPENPSGEPENIECGGDDDNQFTLENGGIAHAYLKKWEGK